ncbi:MAG: hypothetical protein R3C68_00290 [Myxococcota bacterium]
MIFIKPPYDFESDGIESLGRWNPTWTLRSNQHLHIMVTRHESIVFNTDFSRTPHTVDSLRLGATVASRRWQTIDVSLGYVAVLYDLSTTKVKNIPKLCVSTPEDPPMVGCTHQPAGKFWLRQVA